MENSSSLLPVPSVPTPALYQTPRDRVLGAEPFGPHRWSWNDLSHRLTDSGMATFCCFHTIFETWDILIMQRTPGSVMQSFPWQIMQDPSTTRKLILIPRPLKFTDPSFNPQKLLCFLGGKFQLSPPSVSSQPLISLKNFANLYTLKQNTGNLVDNFCLPADHIISQKQSSLVSQLPDQLNGKEMGKFGRGGCH